MKRVTFLLLFLVIALDDVTGITEMCTGAKTCEECIKRGPSCSWCTSSKINGFTHSRCGFNETLLTYGCPKAAIYSVQYSEKVARNETPSDEPTRRIEAYPQYFKISLRRSQKTTIPFKFRKAAHYPVDLYILSDLTDSMKKYTKKIASSAKNIFKEMKKVTRHFRMGFGAFADKNMLPYTSPNQKGLCRMLKETDDGCEEISIGYRHDVNLTEDTDSFQEVVANMKTSVVVDAPEGGLDAILQAAVCPTILGWNPDAHKIILFLTDGGIHVGGDGLLAGLVQRAEERCHMGRKTPGGSIEYLKSTELDYPTVAQIIKVLEQSNIAIIFGVTQNMLPIYINLANTLPAASVSLLFSIKKDGGGAELGVDNVVKFIRESYDKVTSGVTIKGNFKDIEGLMVKLETQCEDSGPWTENTKCESAKPGSTTNFRLHIEAVDCLNAPQNLTFKFSNSYDTVTFEVSTICTCPNCDSNFIESDSKVCGTSNGDLVCGLCRCKPGWKGLFCECPKETRSQHCEEGDSSNECSGRGVCSCGKCKCFHSRYNGNQCECDSMSCPLSADDATVCGGGSRGICNCNKTCTCLPGYKGLACDCLIDRSKGCSNPDTAVLCSGHGSCECGVCTCDFHWHGRYCEETTDSSTTQGPVCLMYGLRECVQCHHDSTPSDEKNANETCAEICNKIKDVEVDVQVQETVSGEGRCHVETDNCHLSVGYFWSQKIEIVPKLNLIIKRSCVDFVYASATPLVLGVIGGIILIGLITLLIWRVVAYYEDKQEFNAWLEERNMSGLSMTENPLYVSPETVTMNPLHVPETDETHYRLVD